MPYISSRLLFPQSCELNTVSLIIARIVCLSKVCATVIEDSQYNALAETRKHDRENVNVQDHTRLGVLEDKRLSRYCLHSQIPVGLLP
jgi:hypothetical protein